MRQLCKHDWVGDDDCAYCKGEKAEGLYMVMRRDFEERGDIIVELESENSRLREALAGIANTYPGGASYTALKALGAMT